MDQPGAEIGEIQQAEAAPLPLHDMVGQVTTRLAALREGKKAHDPDLIVLDNTTQRIHAFQQAWEGQVAAYYAAHPELQQSPTLLERARQLVMGKGVEVGRAIIDDTAASGSGAFEFKEKSDGQYYPSLELLKNVRLPGEDEPITPSEELRLAFVQDSLGIFQALKMEPQTNWEGALKALQDTLGTSRRMQAHVIKGSVGQKNRIRNLPTALPGMMVDIDVNTGRIYGVMKAGVLNSPPAALAPAIAPKPAVVASPQTA